MDLQKLRYDLAMQTAVARLALEQETNEHPTYECKDLLDVFAQCYDECKRIPKCQFDNLKDN